jgi:tetratricopeptide (TPR) repeat protein
VAASLAAAQRPARDRRSASSATSSVRAELASVLLQSGRYDEAAREYRLLLGRDPSSYEYRLRLAQALAWGDHAREAERELMQLEATRPRTPVVDSLLRAVRDAYDPSAVEAAGWVAAEPGYAPYRLALARALAREKMPRLAIAQFDTLLTRPGVGRIPDRGMLLREIANAFVNAGDRMGGVGRLVAALAYAPNDTAMRHLIAGMLADGHHYAEAKAQYDTLLVQDPSGPLLLERAQVRLALGERSGAESDLWASARAQPSAAAYLLLGDLFRERGDYRGARSMYLAAAQGAPREMRASLAAALALLDREERPAVLADPVGDDPGWRVDEEAAADNIGIAYSVLSLRRTLPIASATRVSLGAEWRQLAERTGDRQVDAGGFGATAGAWQEASYGALLARIAVDGGAIYHPLAGTLGEGHGALSAWLSAWQATFAIGTEPAYPSLFSAEALLPRFGGRPLMERDAAISIGGPFGPLDIGARWERSTLSDGNRRLTLETAVRYPLAPHVFALYSGNGVAFADRSTLYWDPDRFLAQGVGLEYAVRHVRGLSIAARVVPTFASSAEAVTPAFSIPGDPSVIRGPITHHTAWQFVAGAEAAYRTHAWELAGALSYGRGRADDYERAAASIALRLLP